MNVCMSRHFRKITVRQGGTADIVSPRNRKRAYTKYDRFFFLFPIRLKRCLSRLNSRTLFPTRMPTISGIYTYTRANALIYLNVVSKNRVCICL